MNNNNIINTIIEGAEKEVKHLRRMVVGATAIVAVSGVVTGYCLGEMKELREEVASNAIVLEANKEVIKGLQEDLNKTIEERDCLKDENNCLIKENSEYQRRLDIAKKEAKEASKAEKMSVKQAKSDVIASFDAELTAYYPEDSLLQGGFVTATGHDLEPLYFEGKRIIAVTPEIPLYSLVNITDEAGNTYECIALDRGGRIKGNKIDIVHKDRESAYKFGVQIGKAEIIRLGKGAE